MKHTFTIPGFRRLYAGMAASMLGDSVMLLVLSMWVKELTGSNSQAGLTFLFMMLPGRPRPGGLAGPAAPQAGAGLGIGRLGADDGAAGAGPRRR